MMQDKDHVVRRGLKIILKSVGSKVCISILIIYLRIKF